MSVIIDALAATVERIVDQEIDHMNTVALRGWNNLAEPQTELQFVVRVALHIIKAFGIEARKALPMAVRTLRDFERDERVTFGHRDFAWDDDAARLLALEYWENR